MNFAERREGSNAKRWRDIWGSGQGIGAVKAVVPAAGLVARLRAEYDPASARFAGLAAQSKSCWSGGGATALAV
jgi:nitronate monooxygenase